MVAVIILVGLVAYMVFNQPDVEYQTIAISNGTTIEVPVSNQANTFKDNLGIFYYQDPKYDVNITSWNSQEELSIMGAVDISSKIELQKGGATPSIENGVPIYYNKNTDSYCIEVGNNTTHDNILIVCKDKDTLIRIYSSIKFGVSDVSNIANITDSSSSDSSRYVSDENGVFDTVSGKYINGQFSGHTKSEASRLKQEMAYNQGYTDGYYDADFNSYDDYYYDEGIDSYSSSGSGSGSGGSGSGSSSSGSSPDEA